MCDFTRKHVCDSIYECSLSKRKRKFTRLQDIEKYTKTMQVFFFYRRSDDATTGTKYAVRRHQTIRYILLPKALQRNHSTC